MTISLKLKPILLISMCRLIINIPIILSILYQYHDIILCNPSYNINITVPYYTPDLSPVFLGVRGPSERKGHRCRHRTWESWQAARGEVVDVHDEFMLITL